MHQHRKSKVGSNIAIETTPATTGAGILRPEDPVDDCAVDGAEPAFVVVGGGGI